MKIVIKDLEFQAVIGLLKKERKTPQRVLLNIEIKYKYKNKNYLDYAEVVNIAKNLIIEKKYLLLEDALEDLIKILKKEFPQISSIKCQISKPEILPECIVFVKKKKRF